MTKQTATTSAAAHQPAFKWPLFRLAFRPLFLLGSLFSIVSLWLWVAIINGDIHYTPYGAGLWWHVHEMLFGFVIAIVTGFLLTAVQSWTQQPGVRGWSLVLLVTVWTLSRILMIWQWELPLWIIAALDLLYLPLAAFYLARPILKVRQWRNVFFVPLLLLMALLNLAMHWMAFTGSYQYLILIANTMVMMISLMMVVIGGRVFPMFTANGTGTQKVAPIQWLETIAVGSVVLSVAVTVFATFVPGWTAASIYLIAGLANAYRVLRWRISVTLRTPLVWSLHLSYWCLAAGFLALAAASLGWGITVSQSIHIITVGAIGGMILAMICRVSLGHTGRTIVADGAMTTAFTCIFLAALVRVVGLYFLPAYSAALNLSVILWSISFGLFLYRFTPFLLSGRPDGAAG